MNDIKSPGKATPKNFRDYEQENFIKTDEKLQDAVILSLSQKLKQYNIKPASIVHKCEMLDRNKDELLHIDDLHEVFNESLGIRNSLTQREMFHLAASLGGDRNNSKGIVQYKNLFDLLDKKNSSLRESARHSTVRQSRSNNTNWATQKGSVGEWLSQDACPAEIKNLKRLMSSLEDFERNSGMKCVKKDDGFLIPLGPNLKASIKIHVS